MWPVAHRKTKLRSCYGRNVCALFPPLTSVRSLGVAGKLPRSNATPIPWDVLPKSITQDHQKNRKNLPLPFLDRSLFPVLAASSSLRSLEASSRIFGTLVKSNGTTSSGSVL